MVLLVTCDNSMIVVGGMNNDGSYGKVYRVILVDGKAEVSVLPSMPCSVDNMAVLWSVNISI